MRIDDRREAVRDENHRAIAGGDQAIQRALHGRLGLGVQGLSVDHRKNAQGQRVRQVRG